MINLLPPSYADMIRFGRSNTRLRSWLIGLIVSIGILLLIFAVSWLYVSRETGVLNREIAAAEKSLKEQNLEKVQKDAEEISGNIKIISQVLSQEIRFSSLIQDIGKVLPPGTVLSSLTLSDITGAIDLSAKTRDQNSAAQIAVNLNDPKNLIFEKVDIVNINCRSGVNAANYRCDATYRALFSVDAQERYLNVAKDDAS